MNAIINGGEIKTQVFQYQIVENLIPQIGSFLDNGYTTEEMKMQNEGRKIMHLPELLVNCTCVRVPVVRSHSISCVVKTKEKISDAERGYLGISCINVTSELSENYNMPEGVFVAQVYEGTGADEAGLVRGDIIVAFDGTEVKDQTELTRLMGYYKVGETVEITIMQGSPTGYQAKNVQVTLSSYEQLNQSSQAQTQQEAPAQEQQESGQNYYRSPFWP